MEKKRGENHIPIYSRRILGGEVEHASSDSVVLVDEN